MSSPEPIDHAYLPVGDEAVEVPWRLVVVRGELDLSTAPGLKAELLDMLRSGDRRLLIELELTGQIDSSGLAVLVGVQKRLHRVGGSLVVLIDNAHVAHKFKAVGLDRVLTIVRSHDEAIVELEAASPARRTTGSTPCVEHARPEAEEA